MKIYKIYLFFLFLSVFIFFSFVCTLNYIIDPYGIYNFKTWEGFNDKKPYINGKTRFHKTQKLLTDSFDCIFLGSSRVESAMNFSKKSILFKYCNNYYNAGLSYATILEEYHLIQLIHRYQKKPKLFIGLDFLQFNANTNKSTKELDYFKKPLFYRYASLISFSVLKDSINTINSKKGSFYLSNGSWKIMENYLENFPQDLNLYFIFLITEKGFNDIFYQEFTYSTKNFSTLNNFKELLAFLYLNSYEVYFFINPFHVRLLEILDSKIGYNQFEEWKLLLIEIITNEGLIQNKTPYRLYDFSGYNLVTTELITKQTKESKYFYDSSHVKPEVGEWILLKILENHNIFSDFGESLNKTNIYEYLKNQRKKRDEWREAHKEIIKELFTYIKLNQL